MAYFSVIPEPRHEVNKLYPLEEVIAITILAVLCEITAIPTLLEKIALEGSIITIDAMGCQYEIANKIVRGKVDYLFSLKGNQDGLYKDVKEYFAGLDFNAPASQVVNTCRLRRYRPMTQGHGRIEERDYAMSDDVAWVIKNHPNWGTIKSIGMAEPTRTLKDKATGTDKTTTERRFFIASLKADPRLFADTVRAH
jgi:predicted transposase YbfD/YdcC